MNSRPMRTVQLARATVLAALLAVASGAVLADADVDKPPVNNADFDVGAEAIKVQDWQQAVVHLEMAVKSEPTNADARNLLGYAYRNQRKFDLAFREYGEALKLNPQHKGAHEYIGEAYVLTGNKAKAQEHLAALERICGKGCEEYQDLSRAIAQAK
ncbi:MAG: tetratricopeptide repeat protein [Betaproteobacteria bacterium]